MKQIKQIGFAVGVKRTKEVLYLRKTFLREFNIVYTFIKDNILYL